MQIITQHFINGKFAESHGTEVVDVKNPTTNKLIGRVIWVGSASRRYRVARLGIGQLKPSVLAN